MRLLVETLNWPAFLDRFRWIQGEHLTLVGPTGCGKTSLARELLKRRRYVLLLAAKPKDPVLMKMAREDGYRIERSWPPKLPAAIAPKVILWPRVSKMADYANQRDQFARALAGVYEEGGWCVYADELRYLTEQLKLGAPMELLWLQGRSLKLSIVGGTQRPFKIPQEAFDQATHLFLWKDSDSRNLVRMKEIGGSIDRDAMKASLEQLDKHSFLYANTRTGDLVRSRMEV